MRNLCSLLRSLCLPASRVVVLAGLFLLLPLTTLAAQVTVDCDGGPADFPTITAALNALDLIGPNNVVITGTCIENVFINITERLHLFSAPGTTATIRAANASDIVVHIFQSRSITLSGIVIEGGSRGVLVNNGSDVTLRNCTIQNNSSHGVFVQVHSILNLMGTVIQDNRGSGLVANGSSMVTAGNTTSAGAVLIVRNRQAGITVDGSLFHTNSFLTVEDNLGAAISVRGGRLLLFATSGENLYRANRLGISINGGSADFAGQHTIQNNGLFGVQVFGGASANFNSATLPGGSLGVTTIEGHSTAGMNIVRFGEVALTGPHVIRNNGSATADPTLRGGIRVSRAALTMGGGTQVTGNFGPGILLEINGNLFTTNVSLTGNTEEGVRVLRQSVAGLVGPHTITGNGTFAVSCDVTSLVFGDLAGTAPINCARIEREFGPPRPGDIH